MKRVVTAAGAFAVGVAGMHGANDTGLTPRETSKWWLSSASLRSFYDDNSLNAPNEFAKGSFGFQFRPGIAANLPLQRTLVQASYDFTMNFFEARPENKVDQEHEFDGRLNHKFSKRYELDLAELFSYADSPEVLDRSGSPSGSFRGLDASRYLNRFSATFSARLRPAIGAAVGYRNTRLDYVQSGFASYSALLDQLEHQFHFDAQWFASQYTILFGGYQIGFTEYTSKDSLGRSPLPPFLPVFPDEKNARSHYFYVGTKRELSRQLEGVARVGAQLTDYYKQGQSSWSPYVDIVTTYTYLPQSFVRMGINVVRYPTDTGLGPDGSVALDQLTSGVYVTVNHQLTSLITGSLTTRFQHSVFNGGFNDGDADDDLTVDMSLDYKIRENLYANVAYIWNTLSSSRASIEFSRNRVFLGIRATY